MPRPAALAGRGWSSDRLVVPSRDRIHRRMASHRERRDLSLRPQTRLDRSDTGLVDPSTTSRRTGRSWHPRLRCSETDPEAQAALTPQDDVSRATRLTPQDDVSRATRPKRRIVARPSFDARRPSPKNWFRSPRRMKQIVPPTQPRAIHFSIFSIAFRAALTTSLFELPSNFRKSGKAAASLRLPATNAAW